MLVDKWWLLGTNDKGSKRPRITKTQTCDYSLGGISENEERKKHHLPDLYHVLGTLGILLTIRSQTGVITPILQMMK